MEFLKDLNDISRHDRPTVGGKAAALGELLKMGFIVPCGFVICTSLFDLLLKQAGLGSEIIRLLHTLSLGEISTVRVVAERLQGLVSAIKIPTTIARDILNQVKKLGFTSVAVRSSAAVEDSPDHSWAGQFESYLNVQEKDIIDRVKNCWASAFSSRALMYRLHNNFPAHPISMAVIIQKMVESDASGVAFSIHPITGEKGRVCVETEGRLLAARDMDYLSDIVMLLEKSSSYPCDVEWGRERGVFNIVQCRPITVVGESNVSI